MECVKNFDLKNYNTYRISSVADVVYFPQTIEEFVELLKTLENPFVLGGGSNLLLSSSGIKEPVILTTKLDKIENMTFEAGVKTPIAAQTVLKNSLCGFEFLSTIPGTIGGAVTMNASAHGQKISDTFFEGDFFDFQEKKIVKFQNNEMKFGYRTSILKSGRYVFLKGKFELSPSPKDEIEEKMKKNLEYRKIHQPSLKTPNAGSVFKNPPNESAGALIEKCGLKGEKIGGAEISTLHGNFILSDNAASIDIARLMFLAYNEVKKQTNIELEPEIIFVGKKTELEEEIWGKISKKPSV